jgi:2-iminoacetate synthase
MLEVDPALLEASFDRTTDADVQRALRKETLDDGDILALLSPAARPHLEAMAQASARLTRRRFGRTMQLYAPLYVSNECVNRCAYCGFAHDLPVARRTLAPDEIVEEARWLHEEGFRHLLLVAGESPRLIDVAYLEDAARRVSHLFESISIEVAPFDEEGYRRLVHAGIDGMTLYQETYLPSLYRKVHLAGPKTDAARRFDAADRAGRAGFRSLGVGALLGLGPWRVEAFCVAQHARALTKRYWKSRIGVSFPRIRAAAGGFAPLEPVSDADLVQMICTMRLALPDAELVLSTREPASLRDHLALLGITRMSAGSKTSPGGYGQVEAGGDQFEVVDTRTASEVAAMIEGRGLEPVWKDFDRAFVAQTAASG